MQWGGGGVGCKMSSQKVLGRSTVQHYQHYEGVSGGQISRKKHYVTLEWPLIRQLNTYTMNPYLQGNSGMKCNSGDWAR